MEISVYMCILKLLERNKRFQSFRYHVHIKKKTQLRINNSSSKSSVLSQKLDCGYLRSREYSRAMPRGHFLWGCTWSSVGLHESPSAAFSPLIES